jgi:hypothetical protein
MPPRRLVLNRTPYTKTLSALLKTDLIRLSTEFRLPTDGPVVTLRNRLRAYLNYHSAALTHNPRYRALFPGHRRNRSPTPPPSSPDLSYRTPSPTPSFDSWDGINDFQQPQFNDPQPPQQHPPVFHPPPPPSTYVSDFDSPPPVLAIDERKYPTCCSSYGPFLHRFLSDSLRALYAIYCPFDTMQSSFGHYAVLAFSSTLCSRWTR